MTTSDTTQATSSGWSVSVLAALARSEYRKTVSTSAWWALLIPAAVLCWLIGLIMAKIAALATTFPISQAFALSVIGTKFVAILGVVSTTSEFRHRTVTTSYLVSSGRLQLLLAKAAVAGAIGVGYAIVCSLLSGVGILMAGGDLTDDSGGFFGVSAVALVVFLFWAVLGVGLGALLNNQAVAIIGLLVYLMLGEQLVNAFAIATGVGHVQSYLPGGSSSESLNNLAASGAIGDLLSESTMPWWLSLIIFMAYAIAIFVAGVLVSRARDVT
ncbi:MAG TPA: hypothetical protein VFE65_16930 [Pseudonocardia sp.]|jgi:hypothetical protein|nr:hypothetical protein [Pseudonocardia sp.]